MTDTAVTEHGQELRKALEQARRKLPDIERLDESLGSRMKSRFIGMMEDHERKLEAPGDDYAEVFLEAENLLAEFLDYLYGAAARSVKIDGGVCQLAEAWLDQLSDDADLRPVGVVIPADAEFMSTLAQVIRLRFYQDGVYGLPIAAHEYGHFVADQLVERKDRDGLPDWVFPVAAGLRKAAEEAERPKLWRMGHEIFADTFATYVCGPAYAHAYLRPRYQAEQHRVSDTHPTVAARAGVILATLDKMAETDDAGGWLPVAAGNLRRWAKATGRFGDLTMADELEEIAQLSWSVLEDDRHTGRLRYRTYPRACELAERLPDTLQAIEGKDSVADLLNAAWRYRAGTRCEAKTLDKISARVSEQCARLVAHG